jgi:hypothetical protein
MKITCPTCNVIYNVPSYKIPKGNKASAKCKKCGGRILVDVKVETAERRKHPRTKTKNLLSYVGIDDRGNQKEQGMGKAIDVSVGGILIETLNPIISKGIVLTVTGTKGELINIEGKVVNHRLEGFGVFRTGIQFIEDEEKNKSFIINLIKEYSKQKTQH